MLLIICKTTPGVKKDSMVVTTPGSLSPQERILLGSLHFLETNDEGTGESFSRMYVPPGTGHVFSDQETLFYGKM
jgi:hypothetical protein